MKFRVFRVTTNQSSSLILFLNYWTICTLKEKTEQKALLLIVLTETLTFNWHAKMITQEILENKEYKWGHSTHRGFFIGMKLNKKRKELQAFFK